MSVSDPVLFISVDSPYKRSKRSEEDFGRDKDPTAKYGGVDLHDRVIEMKVVCGKGKAATAELRLWNQDLALLDSPIIHHGAKVRLAWGYSGYVGRVHTFRVSKVKAQQSRVKNFGVLKVICKGPVQDLNGKAKCRVFRNMTPGQVARKIARSYGFGEYDIIITEDGNEEYEQYIQDWFQVNQTDAQFLGGIAQRLGWRFEVKGGKFVFAPEEKIDKSELPIGFYTYYTDEEGWIKRFEPTSDVQQNFARVTVKGRDAGTGKSVCASITAEQRRKKTLGKINPAKPTAAAVSDMLSAALDAGFTGVADAANKYLQNNLFEQDIIDRLDNAEQKRYVRSLRRVHREQNRPGTPVPTNQVINRPGASSKRVRQEAANRQVELQRRGIEARVLMLGDPDLWAHRLVYFDGLAMGWSGLWKIVECTHTINNTGYTCELKCRKDGLKSLGKSKKVPKDQVSKAQAVGSQATGKKYGIARVGARAIGKLAPPGRGAVGAQAIGKLAGTLTPDAPTSRVTSQTFQKDLDSGVVSRRRYRRQ